MVPERHRATRPFGLYAITALLLVNAILIALDATRSYVGLGVYLGLPRPHLPGLHDADVDRFMRFLTAGAHLAAAIGLWTFRRWAWAALMIVVGIALGEGLLRYARGQPEYLNMLFNVLIVFYLNQRDVQRLFKGADATPRAA